MRLGIRAIATPFMCDNGPAYYLSIRRKFQHVLQGINKSGGSGLGLFIIKEAVEKIGGRIEVDSPVWEGSKFEIYLNPNKAKSCQGWIMKTLILL